MSIIGRIKAKNVSYKNTNSGLISKNVNNAIDELSHSIDNMGGTYAIRQVWENITGQIAGTITTYANTTIIENKWTQDEDALVVEIIDGTPTEKIVVDGLGNMIYADIEADGSYTLTGTPTATNYALIWEIIGELQYLKDIPKEKIIISYDVGLWVDDGSIRTRYSKDLNIQNKNIKNIGNIQLDDNYTITGLEPTGTNYYDAENDTLSTVLRNGVILQHGQELIPLFKNQTGTDIPNGTPVGFAGVVGASGRIKIQPMIADGSIPAKYYIGITTEDIPNGDDGHVATFGAVRGIKTDYTGDGVWGTTWVVGQELYVSATNAGILTNIKPDAPYCVISAGAVQIINANVGQVASRPQFFPSMTDLCDVNGTPLDTTGQMPIWDENTKTFDFIYNPLITKEPTGFTNPENVIITGNGDRTITLTGSNWDAYYLGLKNTTIISGWTSPAHETDTTKAYFLIYDGSTIDWIDASTLTDTFFDNLLICLAFYNNTDANWVYQRECHGLMQWQVHRAEHLTIGTYKRSGGTLADYNLNSTTEADRRPSISACLIYDEDLLTTNSLLEAGGTYTQFYLSGAGATANFITSQSDIIPLSTNQPYYNQFTGGVWQQTLMSTSYYANIWLFALPMALGTNSQKLRFLFVQPQREFSTLANAQSENINSISLGALINLTSEFAGIVKITIRYIGGNWQLIEINNLTGTKATQVSSPSGNYLSAVSTDGTIDGLGTVGSPLSIQTSLNTKQSIPSSSANYITKIDNAGTGTEKSSLSQQATGQRLSMDGTFDRTLTISETENTSFCAKNSTDGSFYSSGINSTDGGFIYCKNTIPLRLALAENIDGGGFSEKARIHTNGFLGIGNNNPQYQLSVQTTGANTAAEFKNAVGMFKFNPNDGGWAYLESGNIDWNGVLSEGLRITGPFSEGDFLNIPTVQIQANKVKTKNFRASGGGIGYGYSFEDNGGDDDTGMYCLSDGELSFYTNSSRNVVIDGSGRVGIGYTSMTYKLQINGDTANTTGTIANISDERAKNISDISIAEIEKFSQLDVKKYQYKNYKDTNGTYYGFIAQDVYNIVPEQTTFFNQEKVFELEQDALNYKLARENDGFTVELVHIEKELDLKTNQIVKKEEWIVKWQEIGLLSQQNIIQAKLSELKVLKNILKEQSLFFNSYDIKEVYFYDTLQKYKVITNDNREVFIDNSEKEKDLYLISIINYWLTLSNNNQIKSDLSYEKEQLVINIKKLCQEKILKIYPDYKQRNIDREAYFLIGKMIIGGNLTEDEQKKLDEQKNMNKFIDKMRIKSNELDKKINECITVEDLLKINVEENQYWEIL